MTQPYNPALPIKMFFEQIETACDLVHATGTAYTEAQLVSIIFSLIFQQGVVNNACCMWQSRPAAKHTWYNFVQHFTEAYQELTELQLVAHQGGSAANNVMGAEPSPDQAVQMLGDLLHTTEEDKITVNNLTTANSQLTQQVANLTHKMADKDTEMNDLKQRGGKRQLQGGIGAGHGQQNNNRELQE
eukprot:6220759-Ditylum_brightwellii.AAC.1